MAMRMIGVVVVGATCACCLLAAADTSTALGVDTIRVPLERVAFGSCNDQSRAQPMWTSIMAREPQLWLWMGDVIYGDYKEMRELKSYVPPFEFFRDAPPEMLHDKYERQLAHPEYTRLRREMPVIGVWDDHDYGRNDGDRTYAHRVHSQSLFLDFVGEPLESPRRRQEGVYTSYTIGSGDRTVKFILLDVRYHKDPYVTGAANGDFLGTAQWQWLERELATSHAAFNVVVSSVQVLPTDRFYGGEQWHQFPPQRERLLRTLLRSSAKGVILLSGDVHYAEINQVQCDDYRNLITEVTSSGLTHSVDVGRNPLTSLILSSVFAIASYVLPWEFRPRHTQVFTGLNVGELTFDWDAAPMPTATARVFDVHGVEQLAYTFASQYFVPGDRTEATRPLSCHAIRQEALVLVLVRRGIFVCIVTFLLAVIPMCCALALGALFMIFRRALARMQTWQREDYHKIE